LIDEKSNNGRFRNQHKEKTRNSKRKLKNLQQGRRRMKKKEREKNFMKLENHASMAEMTRN